MLKYLLLYEDRGIEIEYAEGQYVWDSNGRRYLDMHTGHGVAFLGHRNSYIVNTIINQMNKIITLSTSFKAKIREEMLETLSKIVPGSYEYVYLLNSGSEAVEFALKISRKVTDRKKIIYFTNSFHGRTFGALSVTANHKYRKGFEPLLPETIMLKYNDVSEIDKAIDEETAAVILELIQGEGGINVASKEFVHELRKKTMDVGALLIIDEIQTGFGRTGSIWLSEQYSIYPDILLAGKAIGGGFPVSVIFMPHDIGVKIERGSHGSTYGGNPIACTAVKASTEVLINDSVPQKAYEKGNIFFELLRKELKDVRIVRDIRGAGLMIGIDLRIEPSNIIKNLQNEGIIALKSGTTVLRLLPPYIVTNSDIEYAVKIIARTITNQISS